MVNSLGNPLLALGFLASPQEPIWSMVLMAILSSAGSPPMESCSPGKIPPSMLIGWLPGSNRAYTGLLGLSTISAV